jgi:hypothetical protein
MHAGAVLDSKVVSNISALSIRTEYAGAHTAFAAYHSTAMWEPFMPCWLFLSVIVQLVPRR